MLDTHRARDLRDPRDLHLIADQLRTEFTSLPYPSVERCVTDTVRRAHHLGCDVTPGLVERVAREHLRAMVNAEPPSRLGHAPRPRPSIT